MADSGGTGHRRQLRTRRKLEGHVATQASTSSSSAGVDIPRSADIHEDRDGDTPLATSPDGDADFPIFYGTPPSVNAIMHVHVAVFNGDAFVEASMIAGTAMARHVQMDTMLDKLQIQLEFSHRDVVDLANPVEIIGVRITRCGWTVKTVVLASVK